MALTRKQFFGCDGKSRRVVRGESAVLISSHQLSEVEKIADRIVAIDDGMVCFDGKLDDLSDRFENLEEFYKNLYGADKK